MSNDVLWEVLEARAERDDSPFAYFQRQAPLTAAELLSLAEQTALHLAAAGVRRGDRLMLLFPPSPEQLATVLACWRLGAVAVPLDRFIRPEGLAPVLEVLAPGFLVTASAAAPDVAVTELVEGSGARLIDVDATELVRDARPAAFSTSESSEDDVALVLFTSGSTGLPKGVVHSKSSLVAGARNVVSSHELGPDDRGLCVLPLSHMNGLVTTFLGPLVSGGSVVYMQEAFSGELWRTLVESFRCSWFSAVPMHYQMLLSPPVPLEPEALLGLRFCRSASAPLSERVLTEFEAHYCVPIVETMGTTETAGQIFSNPLHTERRRVGSVGTVYGFDVRIVDDDGVQVALGSVGEVQVRGDAMFRGYWQSPDHTKLAFTVDGWFRTGDLGCEDAEGFVVLKGRKKDIAIFCGLNISLRQIEATVFEAGVVRDVAAVGVEHRLFGEVVRVFAIAREDGEAAMAAAAKQVRLLAAGCLPGPSALRDVVFVNEFPRSSAGKVLKGRLDAGRAAYVDVQGQGVDARALVASALGIDADCLAPDARSEDVREWDSLATVSLIAAIESALDRELAPHEFPVLRSVAGVDALLRGAPEVAAPARGDSRARAGLCEMLASAGFRDHAVVYLLLGFEHCARLGVEDPFALVQDLCALLPDGATLLMNAFTWDFCEGVPYHHRLSMTRVGLVNELFRKHTGVIRSQHPLYSFTALGGDAEALLAHEGGSSWNRGSVCERLLETADMRVLTVGLGPLRGSLLRANPCMHALEERFSVPYRYEKHFDGLADFGESARPYRASMYVRRLDIPVANTWVPVDRLLRERGRAYVTDDATVYAYDNADLVSAASELLDDDVNVFWANADARALTTR